MLSQLYQVNFQRSLGGGEVYTAFLCRALDQLGIATTLYCHPKAQFWGNLALPRSCTLVATRPDALPQILPGRRSWVMNQAPLHDNLLVRINQKHLLTGIAHMPVQGRSSDKYDSYHRVFGVSAYVVDGLRSMGVPVWDEPLYGVSDLQRTNESGVLKQKSEYEWDRRKGRDRIMGMLEPLAEPLRTRPLFKRRPGISLGIVSRLTPI